jgi:glycosyltransferase involved in cell wall biosynthesis
MLQASVIIPAHNPRRDHLDRVLSALRNQSLSYNDWELLLVDNASKSSLASYWDISWHPNARHLGEEALGASMARCRGIAEANADLLIFVDADNVLAENYLVEALRIRREWPTLGTWGSGTIIPEYERPPPEHLGQYLSRLALRDNKRAYWSNVLSCSDATPVGAGMCIRSRVARAYYELQRKNATPLIGREGTGLLSHEDYEMSFVGCSLGFGMGVFPELRMTHLIPKERLSDEYHLRLAEGSETSGILLAYKWMGTLPPHPFSSKGILSMVKNVVLSRGFHRRHHLAIVRARIAARRAITNVGQTNLPLCSPPKGCRNAL